MMSGNMPKAQVKGKKKLKPKKKQYPSKGRKY